ncbi:UNVERIFIED_CONTAM: Labd-13Z-ene-9,15,16-triol synthase, chloroplastic [Sesamum calycinum]|uniref:Labd-13Z-ene-9,15,16-triol synthase, chloroplastic n=1 Tax=Sesamum calycinum TaxID=2727403 RepID=A0AAW2QZN6_9LAMI
MDELALAALTVFSLLASVLWQQTFHRDQLPSSDKGGFLRAAEGGSGKVVRDVNLKLGKLIEIGELVFLTELNVILSLLWGGTIDEEKRDKLGAQFRDKMLKLVDLLGKPNVSDFFPVLAKFDVQGIEKETRALMPSVEEILDTVIDERMKMMAAEGGELAAEKGKDFLGILLELKEQKKFGKDHHLG